ncbi:phage tail sheath C-terminal domain-containing protein [Caballeronia novacaledonica]|uniref:Tail sheath protein C-terminal domain-containing protein n=1 Tax=Caballeronia novacaledonica TaxID=1544861 RepID=A0AA37MJ55_9BURK|nr:phage tail sheath C-terminal domain-containing protein [Caballeronia novacaledonica]GJH28948.1 hypothetical protein CBA19CS42_30550 [Caballeronia novacaledonica]
MSQMILPGTYIDVLSEGLIAPGQVTVGNVGVVGTASKGQINTPVLLSSYNDALAIFGSYDAIVKKDEVPPKQPPTLNAKALTLTRALELVFSFGATTVYAMRVASPKDVIPVVDIDAKKTAGWATVTLAAADGTWTTLLAASPGAWGNNINCTIKSSPEAVRTYQETLNVPQDGGSLTDFKLTYAAKKDSPRNRVLVRSVAGGINPVVVGPRPNPDDKKMHVAIDGQALKFDAALTAGDKIDATYAVDGLFELTLTAGQSVETYLVQNAKMLAADISNPDSTSSLVTIVTGDKSAEPPKEVKVTFTGGANGEDFSLYDDAQTYEPLLDVDAHIIVAAGQDDKQAGAGLDQHCQKASTDEFKRDRIAVVGSSRATGTPADRTGFINTLVGNTLASDRVIFIAPGIVATSSAPDDLKFNPITLPGAYAAAAIAGKLAATAPHISLTNKPVAVIGLEVTFKNAQLEELVQNRVTALELNEGFRVLRGQTTDTGAFREITTRRIVDYAKYGVRSASAPFIGLLNNDRVRSALRASINSFLQSMLDGEMLVGYGIEVTATREQQIRGIVQVTITLQPVFSINFIQVTMILS